MTEYEKIVEEVAKKICCNAYTQSIWDELLESYKDRWREISRQILSTEVGTLKVAVVDEGADTPNQWSNKGNLSGIYNNGYKQAQQDMLADNWRKVVTE